MKTPHEIAKMAEREYPMVMFQNVADEPATYENYIRRGAYIKGYQKAQEEMKWIDCKDRLPEKIYTETSERVLVWQKNKIYISAYNHTQNFWETNYEDKVTHWMFLPKSPKK